MASLYKRASPQQRRILRIVEGAVRNAAYSHPEFAITNYFARSIAKRAAGTLTAQWPDVLAARSLPSDRADANSYLFARPRDAKIDKRRGRGLSHPRRRQSPLRALWKVLSAQISPLRAAGKTERADAFVEILKMIAELQRPENDESRDFVIPTKLDIRGGAIHYKIRQQDDTFVDMTIRDTPSNRRFVTWVQIHD